MNLIGITMLTRLGEHLADFLIKLGQVLSALFRPR